MTIKTVAVFFGGRSTEHDVSIVTALQVMSALDPEAYSVLPVYLSTNGGWWTGEILRERATYLPSADEFAKLTQVTLDVTASGRPKLVAKNASMFRKAARWTFPSTFHSTVVKFG